MVYARMSMDKLEAMIYNELKNYLKKGGVRPKKDIKKKDNFLDIEI